MKKLHQQHYCMLIHYKFFILNMFTEQISKKKIQSTLHFQRISSKATDKMKFPDFQLNEVKHN